MQGTRLTFQITSAMTSDRFDFTSQNKFSLARPALGVAIKQQGHKTKTFSDAFRSVFHVLNKFHIFHLVLIVNQS